MRGASALILVLVLVLVLVIENPAAIRSITSTSRSTITKRDYIPIETEALFTRHALEARY